MVASMARMLSLLVCIQLLQFSEGQVVVTVDPLHGDDSQCLSAQEAIRDSVAVPGHPIQPCKTINRALGDVNCNADCSNSERISNVTLQLLYGIHRLTGCVGIVESQNIMIVGVSPDGAIIECESFPNEDTFDNIFVCKAHKVTFRGIQFQHCGPLSSSVFIKESSNIVVEECVFINNSGAPLQAQFVSKIELLHTHFISNENTLTAKPDTGEVSLQDLYNHIQTAGGFTFFSREIQTDITIHNCVFVSNIANRNDVNNSRPELLKANGHGGAILIRLAGTKNSVIHISGCVFRRNEVEVDGGAVYLSLSESASSNLITFNHNTFEQNVAEMSAGGAVSLNSFNSSLNNTVFVEHCVFENNMGNAGGAVSFTLYDNNYDSIQYPNALNFNNSTFRGNGAVNEGTAVGLFSLIHVDDVAFPVSFTDCCFEGNSALGGTENSSAVAAFRFPIIFKGSNYFSNNIGGGLVLLNAHMQASGAILFHSNVALFGGGIRMDDRCLVEIHPGVEMKFINNTAKESGGAVYVDFPSIRFITDIFNRLCFFQYNDPAGLDVPPQYWKNVTITFINNTAGLSGAAIYASDMLRCNWVGNYTTASSVLFLHPEDMSPFHYDGNILLREQQILNNVDLATAPTKIDVTPEHTLVQPGERVGIELLATDYVNNSREAIWALDAPAQVDILDALPASYETYLYDVPPFTYLLADKPPDCLMNGSFSNNFTLTFTLLRSLGSSISLNLSVSGCHPGYVLNRGSCLCECDTGIPEVLRCGDQNRYVYLQDGIWGGVRDEHGNRRRLITIGILPAYLSCDSDGRLPGCKFDFDNPDAQCQKGRKDDKLTILTLHFHSRWKMCGTCEEGYGITLDLQSCSSDGCVAGLVLFAILCVLIVAVSLLILFYNVELTNELKGFLFYAQVIGLVYRPYIISQRGSNSSTDPLGILVNLLGFSVPIPLCLSTKLRTHHIALLGYISPALVLLTVAAYVIGARFIRALGNRSALKGITFLSLFICKYIADTSFIFISCVNTDFGFVFQYDGSVSCTSWEFGIFALLGLILVVLFVAPAPFAVGYICIKRPQRLQQYADVLTKGLKTKHRWWGGWDIGRRLPFVFIAYTVVLVRPSLVLFLMSLTALVTLILHVFVKPYQKSYINLIETAILANLLIVTAIFLDVSSSPVPEWLSTILVLLPYGYATCYFTYITGKYFWAIRSSRGPGAKMQEKATILNKKSDSSAAAQTSKILKPEEDSVTLREPLLECID